MLATAWRVTAAAAVATAPEAREAAAAARLGAASTSDDAPQDREDNETANDDDCDDGPLAVGSLHAIVPAREGSLNVTYLFLSVANNVALVGVGDETSGDNVGYGLPCSGLQAASHCDVDGGHLVGVGIEETGEEGVVEQEAQSGFCTGLEVVVEGINSLSTHSEIARVLCRRCAKRWPGEAGEPLRVKVGTGFPTSARRSAVSRG